MMPQALKDTLMEYMHWAIAPEAMWWPMPAYF
jgi:hypothetical protein